MRKVISESVDRVEEKLSSLYEGFSSKLDGIFDIRLDEKNCSYNKMDEEKEDEDEDEDEKEDTKKGKKDDDCDDADDKKAEKKEVKENVIKNTGKEEVTFSKDKKSKTEKTSKFSKSGDETDGDSGYEDKKPSAETPDKEGESARKKLNAKDSEKVPSKDGKTVKESYGEFKEKGAKLISTDFTKSKEGTVAKTPGYDANKGAEGTTYDKDVDREGKDELEDGKTENSNAGFKEKEKPAGTALVAKKKAFPSKKPKDQGKPGTVKD
jgi:hypothetical protein